MPKNAPAIACTAVLGSACMHNGSSRRLVLAGAAAQARPRPRSCDTLNVMCRKPPEAVVGATKADMSAALRAGSIAADSTTPTMVVENTRIVGTLSGVY